MIFEFLIAYHRTADTEIVGVIRDYLAKVLEDNLSRGGRADGYPSVKKPARSPFAS